MKSFVSRSQAGQDRFVFELLVKPKNLTNGRYIDIGACHPVEISNTYALEQLGWTGILVDNDPVAAKLCREQRTGRVIEGDATTIDWAAELAGANDRPFDYLSLDVDAASLAALNNLMRANPRFRVITAEHDLYRFGPGPRDAIREILTGRGYQLICADVCSSDGAPYEDWYCEPALSACAGRFSCTNKRWPEFFAK